MGFNVIRIFWDTINWTHFNTLCLIIPTNALGTFLPIDHINVITVTYGLKLNSMKNVRLETVQENVETVFRGFFYFKSILKVKSSKKVENPKKPFQHSPVLFPP